MLLLISLLSSLLIVATPKLDKEYHSLVELWENYYKAEAKDRPKDQLNALDKIKKEAKRQRLSWDYYDALQKSLDIRTSVNWKTRDSLRTQMRNELESYNDPIAIFYDRYKYSSGSAADMIFVMNNRTTLENSFNPGFYRTDYRITRFVFGEALGQSLTNDFDYCLWALYSNDYTSNNKNILLNRFKDHYPFQAFLELQGLNIEGHKAFEAKYIDKAVSLFSTQKILLDRFEKLNEKSASQEEYLSLREDLLKTIKKINSFSGSEKLIAQACKLPENILAQLETRRVSASVKDGELILLCQNTRNVSIKVTNSEGKRLIQETLTNKANSYYVNDTIRYRLDTKLLDDTYTISFGDKQTLEYNKYTLSIASRKSDKGLGIYVADYISGEPVKDCSINLFDRNGKLIAQSPTFPLNGFTSIPSSILNKMNDRGSFSIQAVHIDSKSITHLSSKHYLYYNDDRVLFEDEKKSNEGIILCDRGAYNPGDSVFFKAILFTDDKVANSGTQVKVKLFDPKNKLIETQVLKTNEFGSVFSSFALSEELLGGSYRVVLEQNNQDIHTKYILIDEFVLPTFNLTWENDDRIYLPGDVVEVKGNIMAYSGHSLSSANVHYKVTLDRDVFVEGPLEFDSNGNFTIKFNSKEDKNNYASYDVHIIVSDSTGETWGYNRFIRFNNYLNIDLELVNSTKGVFNTPKSEYRHSGVILSENIANLHINSYYNKLDLSYSLSFNNEVVEEGAISSRDFTLDFSDKLSGLYQLKVFAKAYSDSGLEYNSETSLSILKALDSDKALYSDIIGFFKEVEGYGLSLQIGATGGPIWAVVELYSDNNKLLDRKIVKLIGQKGQTGSLRLISFERKESYSPNLSFNVFYFRDKLSYSYTKYFENIHIEDELPIEFIRFSDTTLPSSPYQFAIKTRPEVEALATIFDVSTETIRSNSWSKVSNYSSSGNSFSGYNSSCGSNDSSYNMRLYTSNNLSMAKSLSLTDSVRSEESEELISDVNIRENFENTLYWEPELRPNNDGRIDLKFSTSDKLSKYYVQLFVHDKQFNNNTIRREFTVTLPVKVSFVQPRYLYENDKYVARLNVSNSFNEDIEGDVFFQFSDGKSEVKRVIVPARGSLSFSASPLSLENSEEITILAGFKAVNTSYSSDAVRVSIPILKAKQEIVESHSSLLFASSDKEKITKELRSKFINSDGSDAEVYEISIREMLQNALPKGINLDVDDAISICSAIYCSAIKPEIINNNDFDTLIRKLISCHNSDGGFAWFPGMNSSAMVTAKILEQCFYMGKNCPKYISELIPDAIKWLDRQYFREDSTPFWRGGISLEEYLYVRSMYCKEEFTLQNLNLKVLTNFVKEATKYLTPSNERGLNRQILEKTRRALTLRNLIENKGANNLLDAWGLNIRLGLRAKKSLSEDIISLSQYAEKHSSGGYYFPNAILPYRGLMGSELYAANLLCLLFDGSSYQYIADGLRLWIMVQKETEEWETEPAFVDALCCVAKASDEVLDTKVLVLKSSTEIAIENIKASGNGFRIESEYFVGGKRVNEGDSIKVGDKVIGRHRVWSEENRSFVTIRLPRPSNLRPLVQISGYFSWIYSAYRYIKTNESIFMFESFPEENLVFSEEYFVTQEGTFHSKAPIVESSYAPHYRANGEMISISSLGIQP